ncbi:MAG: glycoside hydrolase domain-containing protein [Nocardioides sp.]
MSVILLAGLWSGGVAHPSYADNRATPGDFTGYGFDQCLTPSQAKMDVWLEYSPFLAAGIYISGDSRACRRQPNLTPTWVSTQLAKGWRLLPITLGPQASCSTRFPRYADDEVIDDDPGPHGGYRAARRQGRAEAVAAVKAARSLGIVAGSTLWYDIEAYDATRSACRESALAFLTGWTRRLHRLDYVSGVYSSAGSGIAALDRARAARRADLALPDYVWLARWDGIANTSTSYVSEQGWNPHRRIKQYLGGHDETWGGVTINIDRNYLDVGRGSVAPAQTWCGGVRVDYPRYRALAPGLKRPKAAIVLKCLLERHGYFRGEITGAYGGRVIRAARRWRADHGFRARSRWGAREWVALLSGGRQPVVKIGSASGDVRRVQRAMNAARIAELRITGVFDDDTRAAVRAWQRALGDPVTGVVAPTSWKRLQAGRF